MPYHICHKCGLTRKITLPDEIDLGRCDCWSKTEFEFERTPRRLDEAVKIGIRRFLDYLNLYIRQGRPEEEFARLVRKYQKVIQHKEVYHQALKV